MSAMTLEQVRVEMLGMNSTESTNYYLHERWPEVVNEHLRRLSEVESRLEAANALLREATEWNWLDDDAPQQAGVNADNPSQMDALYVAIQSHLQGAGDETQNNTDGIP